MVSNPITWPFELVKGVVKYVYNGLVNTFMFLITTILTFVSIAIILKRNEWDVMFIVMASAWVTAVIFSAVHGCLTLCGCINKDTSSKEKKDLLLLLQKLNKQTETTGELPFSEEDLLLLLKERRRMTPDTDKKSPAKKKKFFLVKEYQ